MAFDRRLRRRPVNIARGNAYAGMDLEARLFAPKGMCLSQHDQNVANDTGAAVRSDINNALGALFTLSSGAAAPATTIAHMLWADTTANLLKRRNAANTNWIVVRSLSETFVVARAADTVLAGSDVGKTFVATSTFTQTVTAAATLADGWWCFYRNDGTGVITIDPNGAETIDGAATLKLNPGEACYIACNGTSFKTVGLGLVRGGLTFADNLSISCSVGASALTIALKDRNGNDPTAANPIRVPFRNVTDATGDFAELPVTAATSLVVSSGSTLGTSNSTAFRLWIVGFNDGGAFRLGVINCLTNTATTKNIRGLAGWGIASSTAEGGAGAADSAEVFYTGTAVTSKAYTILGYVTYESGLGTAGTWSAVPTRVQIFGPGVPLPGQTIGGAYKVTNAVVTCTTQIPQDNSIPQNTEGDQVLALDAYTAGSAANLLRFSFSTHGGRSAGDAGQSFAIFKDADADAIAAWSNGPGAGNSRWGMAGTYSRLAGSASAQTFKLRAGPANATTLYLNADSGGTRLFGGVDQTGLELVEVMA